MATQLMSRSVRRVLNSMVSKEKRTRGEFSTLFIIIDS